MTDSLTIALAQLNPSVGDVAGNINKLMTCWREASHRRVDLIVIPELFVTGYPPEDYAKNPNLLKTVRDAVDALARKTATGAALLIGSPWSINDRLYNAALLIDGGKITAVVCKYDLPNYGPFDEKRVYTAGALPEPVTFRNCRLGIMLCEDMWTSTAAVHLRQQGAQALLVLNGSPFESGHPFYQSKQIYRYELARKRIQETSLPVFYVNQIGGQDELVFEGSSFVMDSEGAVKAQAKAWEEDFIIIPSLITPGRLVPEQSTVNVLPQDDESSMYHALMTGVRDYVLKNGFDRVLLGLSGGIDSALVATIAVDALGADKVRAVMMPSPYTSQESDEDARAITRALGCRMDTIPIHETFQAFEHTLAECFVGCRPDATEENIQARCRGVILMALANKSNALVLATGNKSEMATGYATLYGDMCGGYAPLKDVYKTKVYALARWRNAHLPEKGLGPSGIVIPERVLTKAPTAELKPNQTDQDTLPLYDILDNILEGLVERDLTISDVVARGFASTTVRRVWSMLGSSEYKRRQSPPGPKVTSRHLTRDRRYPITNTYVEK